MKEASVTGMAISLFNNNKPVYHKVFGYKNSETKVPLQTNTNFYGASLSKAVFAVLVMKLVEEKIITLDKPLQDYLPKPVTQDDLLAKVERWCRAPLLPSAPPKGSPANTSKSRSV